MRQWRVEVFNRPGLADVQGGRVLSDIRELGITSVEAVQSARVFLIEADFDPAFAERVARELLADPVCEQYYLGRSGPPAGLAKATLIEVHLKSGVTDPVAESVMAAIADMGGRPEGVRTARKYILLGEVKPSQIDTIARKILANDVIEDVVIGDEAEPPSPHLKPYELNIALLADPRLGRCRPGGAEQGEGPVPERRRDEDDSGLLPPARPGADGHRAGNPGPDLERALRAQDAPQRRGYDHQRGSRSISTTCSKRPFSRPRSNSTRTGAFRSSPTTPAWSSSTSNRRSASRWRRTTIPRPSIPTAARRPASAA